MNISTEKKFKETNNRNVNDIDYKINIATQTLERNINFVQNCDNKSSIILTVIGVILTIIFTRDGLNDIIRIVNSCVKALTFCNILYLLCFLSSALTLFFGVYKLLSVLVAITSEEAVGRPEEKSRIFFSGIRKSGNYSTYSSRFYGMTREELLNDLIVEIYINADIATIKYRKYNIGLRCSIFGFVLFFTFYIAGIYIYGGV